MVTGGSCIQTRAASATDCDDRSVTDDEIRVICRGWVRGEHFPVQEADEERLGELIAADADQWWRVAHDMIEDLTDRNHGVNLAIVLALVIAAKGHEWEEDLVSGSRGSRKATAVVVEAFDIGYSDRAGSEDRIRIYELLGRDLVITTWLEYLRTGSGWESWPYGLIEEVITQDPEEAWALITTMIEHVRPEDVDVMGAGFLEDLLGGGHGDAFVDRIEDLAQRSGRFREALGHLWIDGKVTETSLFRIQRAADVPLAKRTNGNPKRRAT